MPDLLLELFSEEIPARMQRKAAEDLRKLVTDALVEAGLVYEGAKAFATPRRLALTVHGLPPRSPDRREERKGPRVGAPEKALEGFLKAAGLASIAEAKVQPDKKGDFYVAVVEKPGRTAEEVIAEIVPAVVRNFPWPKSMRWGAASAQPGSLSWVRPLHSILCVFGPETSDTEVVRFSVGGIDSGDTTRGHRFMAPGEITVRRFDDYAPKLEKARVVLDADRRKEIILADARDRALALGLELVEDEGLLEEVAGLVEWPVVLVGSFDEAFLDIPPEVIRTTIRANQKCFVLRAEGARLSNRFVLVANIEAPDGGAAIVAGNERVIRARLSDARHFYDTDRRDLPGHDAPAFQAAAERLKLDLGKPLDQRMAKLAATNVVFHEKLGTQGERVERIVRLAGEIADAVSKEPGFRAKVERAATLAKADLTTEMVGEFPELQGLMGRYYATAQGEDASVAAAIEDHYKPVGPSDRVPTDLVSVCVALADKLDLLVGFWAIDEKPTGSKDPYALRRAALGVIRIVLENNIGVGLASVLKHCFRLRLAEGGGYRIWRRITELPGREIDAELAKLSTELPFEIAYLDHDSLYSRYIGVIIAAIEADKEPGEEFDFESLADSDTLRIDVETCWDDNNTYDWPVTSAAEALAEARRLVQRIVRLADFTLAHSEFREVSKFPASQRPGLVEDVGIERFVRSYSTQLLAFIADRLKVQLREQGARHDLVDAVLSLGGQDDLLLIVRRVEALGRFLATEDGTSLLAGIRRATNILREEEKKSGAAFAGAVDPALLAAPEERALFEAVGAATGAAEAATAIEDYDGAMRALAALRLPVDAFFEQVRVNDDDPAVRENRLRLLNQIRAATLAVADFSKIEG